MKNREKVGEYPYTRGIYPEMYKKRLWTMRQFAGFGSARDTNERFKKLLKNGGTGLSTAFDMPTLLGKDSDDPDYGCETGRCGVAIDTLADMEILFDGIDLNPSTSTSMTINAPAIVLFAMYLVVAQKKGVDWKNLRGTMQNDILKEYIAQKEWIYPPEPSLRLITDMFQFCSEDVPRWYPISISGYHIREAGSSAVQELAFTLRDGIEYVERAIKAGLDVDEFAPRLSFFFDAHNDFLEEIAKFRAARRIWARTMRERFGAKKEKSLHLRFHTQTAGCTLQAVQPDNNIVRVTLQAMAAVLGGTQSLHTNSKDETLCLPTESAACTALRTQQIIAYESGVTNFSDPFAGSSLMEGLTDGIEFGAMEYIKKIDDMGGMVAAIEQGYPQREIRAHSFKQEKEKAYGNQVVVGVNKFIDGEEGVDIPILEISAKVHEEQVRRLRGIKKSRSERHVKFALEDIEKCAKTRHNLLPVIIVAVKQYATIGEICMAMKNIFGEYQENVF